MSEHERQVLSAMLTSSEARDDAATILTGRDFSSVAHEVIFDTIIQTANDGKPVSAITIGDRLPDKLTYLNELVSLIAISSSTEYHALKVRDASTVRKVREVAARLAALPDTEPDALDLVNAARAELDSLIVADTDDSHETAVYDAIDSLDQPMGTPTPWRDINHIIGGWVPGNLTIIGSRPAVGKSVMGVGAVLDMAHRHICSMMFSLEMPKTQLYLRMLCGVGSVDQGNILHRATSKTDDQHLAEAAAHIAKLPIVVDDRSDMSMAQIRARIRSEQRRRPVGLVVIDFLTLIRPPKGGRPQDRRVEVDEIAYGLKRLAKDLNVPVVALAQLNRGIEGRAEKMPTLSDLRESGGIEMAADNVLLMHRAKNDEQGDPTDLVINIEKSRHGPTGICHLDFQGQFSRAVDTEIHNQWRAS